jgi:hypothetical protein
MKRVCYKRAEKWLEEGQWMYRENWALGILRDIGVNSLALELDI